jgi:hypothetical protein
MSRRYVAKTKGAEAVFQPGEFEHRFDSWQEEQAWLVTGALELLPATYRVLTDTPVHGVTALSEPPTFEAAMGMEQEAMLVSGGHIERAEPSKPTTKKKET